MSRIPLMAAVLAAAWTTLPSTASAQAIVAKPVDCLAATSEVAVSSTCGLKFSHGHLVQNGNEVASEGILTPVSLGQYVRGDSAEHHARAYETGMRWADRTMFLGSALLGYGIMVRHSCNSYTCTSMVNRNAVVGRAAGGTLLLVGIPMMLHARSEARRAISFYNASFAR